MVDPLPGHEDVLLRVDALQVEPAVTLEQTVQLEEEEGRMMVGQLSLHWLGVRNIEEGVFVCLFDLLQFKAGPSHHHSWCQLG